MLRTGQLLTPSQGLCRSASTPGSHPTPGAVLPGTLASPQTGLTPAGCRELAARLRHQPPLLLGCSDARATGRTFGSNLSHVRRRTRFSIGRRAVIRLAEGLLGDANGGLFRVVIEVVEARLQVLIGAAGRVRPEQLCLQDHNLAIRLLGVTTTSRPASVR